MNIIELAREADLTFMGADLHCREDYFTATREELERFAALVRAAALEEAAEWFLYEDNKHLFHSEMLWPHQVAERLRQLKDKP